jgi:hypothetical protein
MNSSKSTGDAMSRRTAIAGGLAALVVPRYARGAASDQYPSQKLRITCVGVGGVGQDYVAG